MKIPLRFIPAGRVFSPEPGGELEHAHSMTEKRGEPKIAEGVKTSWGFLKN